MVRIYYNGMKKLFVSMFVALLLVGFGLAISAEEPVRTWTDIKGATIKAGFVQFSNEKVIIRRDDGVSFKVSPTIFSEKDRKYLDEMSQKLNLTEEVEPDAPVIFKNAKLEAAVRKELKKPDGSTLTHKDLAMLESLNAGQVGITSLAGLEHSTNLSKLMLWNNQITEVKPLANLTKLTALNLSLNQITEVTSLANLTNLTRLNLTRNQITDLAPLTGLTKLTNLELAHNQITDAAPLANLTNLTLLDLSPNKISDIMPLAKLTKLDTLDLGNNPIADVTPLTNLTNLTLLLLGNNPIADAHKAMLEKALPKCRILF